MQYLRKLFRERNIYVAFELSILIKGVDAILEILASLSLLFITPDVLQDFIGLLTADELLEDPHDFIASHLVQSAQYFSSYDQHFLFFYLLSHGAIKLFVVIQLLRKKLWAYPVSMLLLFLLIAYQSYKYYYTSSPWLLGITLVDLATLWLVSHEYKVIRSKKQYT